MRHSLQPHAAGAQEAARGIERALALSRSQWNDATRRSFDQRHAEVVVASSRKLADELTHLAEELATALASLS